MTYFEFKSSVKGSQGVGRNITTDDEFRLYYFQLEMHSAGQWKYRTLNVRPQSKYCEQEAQITKLKVSSKFTSHSSDATTEFRISLFPRDHFPRVTLHCCTFKGCHSPSLLFCLRYPFLQVPPPHRQSTSTVETESAGLRLGYGGYFSSKMDQRISSSNSFKEYVVFSPSVGRPYVVLSRLT